MSLRAAIDALPTAAMPAISAEQGRALDQFCVEHVYVNVEQLMEIAGLRVAEFAARAYPDGTFVAMAGSGGNGGDALVAARHLANWGRDVAVMLSKSPDDLTRITAHHLRAVKAAHIPVIATAPKAPLGDGCVVLDGLLGFGAHGSPYGKAARLIEAANEAACQTIAIDVPSGLDATTGDTPGMTIRADATVALAAPKRGLADAAVAGEVVVADIGVPTRAYKHIRADVGTAFARGPLVRWER